MIDIHNVSAAMEHKHDYECLNNGSRRELQLEIPEVFSVV